MLFAYIFVIFMSFWSFLSLHNVLIFFLATVFDLKFILAVTSIATHTLHWVTVPWAIFLYPFVLKTKRNLLELAYK